MTSDAGSDPVSPAGNFLRNVQLRNYRSIGNCDVRLGALTMLVGRNGSGKSNFLDALRFVVDGLRTSLDHAIRERGGIDAVRRSSTGHPRNIAIRLEIVLPDWRVADYGFEIAAQTRGGFVVKREILRIKSPSLVTEAFFRIERRSTEEAIESSEENIPQAAPDRL